LRPLNRANTETTAEKVTAIQRKYLTLSELKAALRAQMFTGEDKLDTIIKAGTASDLMSDMLTGQNSGVVLLTGLCNVQSIRTSVISDVAAVVLVRGKRPTPEMIDQARQHGLPLLCTPFTMFTSCGRLSARGLWGVEEKSLPRSGITP